MRQRHRDIISTQGSGRFGAPRAARAPGALAVQGRRRQDRPGLGRIMALVARMALLFLPAAASAQEVSCADAVTQLDLTLCAERAWKLADEDLNLAYGFARTLMRQIDADLPAQDRQAEASLRAAQRAWITFRDAGCASEGFRVHGGSMEPMVVHACRERVTRARTEELRALAETW